MKQVQKRVDVHSAGQAGQTVPVHLAKDIRSACLPLVDKNVAQVWRAIIDVGVGVGVGACVGAAH